MPSGIEIRYDSSVIQLPSEMETGIFSLISSITPGVAEIALAEIEAASSQHQQKALMSGLVEAELALELLDEGLVQPLGAAIARGHRIGVVPRACRAARISPPPLEMRAVAEMSSPRAR